MTALMYHDVVDPGADDSAASPGATPVYKITPELFGAHLTRIEASVRQ